MKTCFFCKGPIELAQIDYMAHQDGQYALVKELPVERCAQCGEVYLDANASKSIDHALAQTDASVEHLDVPVFHCS